LLNSTQILLTVLAISPEMTYKTGQMSDRLCSVNLFKSLRLRDCWATSIKLCTYMGHGTKLLGSGILNFDPWLGETTHLERGAYFLFSPSSSVRPGAVSSLGKPLSRWRRTCLQVKCCSRHPNNRGWCRSSL